MEGNGKRKTARKIALQSLFLGNGKSKGGEEKKRKCKATFYCSYFIFLSNTFTLIYNRNQKSLKAFPSHCFMLYFVSPFSEILFMKQLQMKNQFHAQTGRIGKLLLFPHFIYVLYFNPGLECDNLFT